MCVLMIAWDIMICFDFFFLSKLPVIISTKTSNVRALLWH